MSARPDSAAPPPLAPSPPASRDGALPDVQLGTPPVYAAALPSPAVAQRANAGVDESAVRLLEEGAVKYNTFTSRPGYPSHGANLRTHLHVETWVRNTAPDKRVWADIHVGTYDGTVVHAETLPLAFARPAGDGGDVFVLDRELYQGLVATPGSVTPRPDARVVQYRIYYEAAGRVCTDGRVHMCYLKPDAMSS